MPGQAPPLPGHLPEFDTLGKEVLRILGTQNGVISLFIYVCPVKQKGKGYCFSYEKVQFLLYRRIFITYQIIHEYEEIETIRYGLAACWYSRDSTGTSR